jgi:ATP-dependent helicase/nuclease subunit A
LKELAGAQRDASSPAKHAALSASAGTGKTHVLTARVLRLLLSGVEPSSILCLTFTKAGAAEMAERIHSRLASWVRLKDPVLRKELFYLDEANGDEELRKARRLFARVIDSTGGGLRIQTIHAFAQSLLAAFPAEAGLTPGFRPLEGREEKALARSTLAELLIEAEATGRFGLNRDVQRISLRLGEGGAEKYLMACARAPDAMMSLGPELGIEARLRQAFDLPLGDIEEAIERQCCDELFDIAGLRSIADHNRQWASQRGLERASLCEEWLAATPADRALMLDRLNQVWARADGEARSLGKGQAPQHPDYASLVQSAFECCRRLLSMRLTAALVADYAAGRRAGQAFAEAYGRAKRTVGVVDFDDLIRWTEQLLATPGMGDWVRYKLDQQTDHILVDEAQDTNERQWNIVRALAEEFFAGEGAKGGNRTIFTVGDFKQAIFGFQGTNPRSFESAREGFALAAGAVGRDFLDLSIDRSFRSSPPILQLVDRVIGDLGHETLGLPHPPNPHESNFADRGGSVTLWKAYRQSDDEGEEEGEEGWVAETTRAYATKLARQIGEWLRNPFLLEGQGRALRPEDILILVRRRSELAALLVARLHMEGVPVAGVDRLLLSAPLAVKDLLAAARFAVQPLDDLNLAALLVSPLLGWDQDLLFEVAHGRTGALWPHLRQSPSAPQETLDALHSILAMADFATPHDFFETLLSGPLGGRRKLLGRLGSEARDPLEELLSAALDFEVGGASSLQGFLDWFARGDVEIVRDPSSPLDAVRVMTVHGSKGLQSPVVVIADACGDPDRLGPNARTTALALGEGEEIPLFRPRKDELAEPLRSRVEIQDRLDREEHWRLLYVGLTRAEERLYIGGALGARDRGVSPESSWHRAVETSLVNLGLVESSSRLWGSQLRLGTAERPPRLVASSARRQERLPEWLHRPAPVEERPPRPLAPSSIGEDDAAYPPPGPEQRQAALRGKLLHALFERLPAVAAANRREQADSWLLHSAGVEDPQFRSALIEDSCRIVEDPRFAALFDPEGLAEAPIAAVVGDGLVIAGTVDRLMVSEDRILVADFKTGRNAPSTVAAVPPAHVRQMAAYRAALQVIFPGRRVEAALLYTSAPILHLLPDSLLDAHLPGVVEQAA